MDWIKIGDQVPKIKNNQMVVIAQFQKGVNSVIRSYVGVWEEIKTFRAVELDLYYTHYMLVNRPKF